MQQYTLSAGKHTLRATLARYTPQEQDVTVDPDGPVPTVRFKLAPEPRTGTLRVECAAPGVEVIVDGERVGETPLSGPVELEEGQHDVRALRGGTEMHAGNVTIEAGREQPLVIEVGTPPPPKPFRMPTGAWVTGGVAVAALATGATFGALSQAAADDAQAHSDSSSDPDVAAWESSSEAAQSHSLASNITLGIGGAAAVATGIWMLVDNLDDGARASATVTPVATKGGGMCVLGLRY